MLSNVNRNFLQASEYARAGVEYHQLVTGNSASQRRRPSAESDISAIVPKYRNAVRLTVFRVAWVGFWTVVVVYTFTLLLR